MNDISVLTLFFPINNKPDLPFLLRRGYREIADDINDHGNITIVRGRFSLVIIQPGGKLFMRGKQVSELKKSPYGK